MKTTPFLEYILYDIFDEKDEVTARAMMGAHVLYKEGKVFAIAEDDELWLKGSSEVSSWYIERGARKFGYMKKDKEGNTALQEMNFYSVPEEVLEDKEVFNEWVEVAMLVAEVPKSSLKVRKVKSL